MPKRHYTAAEAMLTPTGEAMAEWGRRFVAGELINPESAPTEEGRAALRALAAKQRRLLTDRWMPQLSAATFIKEPELAQMPHRRGGRRIAR